MMLYTFTRFPAYSVRLLLFRGIAVSPKMCLMHARNSSTIQKPFRQQFKPIYKSALDHPNRIAVVDSSGEYSYLNILNQSWTLSQKIVKILEENGKPGMQERISFLCPNDVNYVIVQWACWISKNVAVPLCKLHPEQQLEYYVQDSQSSIVIATKELLEKIEPVASKLSVPLLTFDQSDGIDVTLNDLQTIFSDPDFQKMQHEHNRIKTRHAMILYTSGTTGLPKGVILTHNNLSAQTNALVKAWEFSMNDIVLHALPLHHMHGILNGMLCPLSVGGCCFMLPKFEPAEVWRHLVNEDHLTHPPNILMGVPTMYVKLIEEHVKEYGEGKNYPRTQDYIRATCLQNIRFMACGSAPLPPPIMEKWEAITGHKLLERYGMTEIGMALSNPLHGSRIPGCVGQPLPGVKVRISRVNVYSANGYDTIVEGDERSTNIIAEKGEKESGDLLVMGPNVFAGYWNKPQDTRKAFTKDGWFKTGDTAKYCEGVYQLLGRTSVDVIKSGGYKISALEVERYILGHINVLDCSVVGLPDMTWGEKVAAVIVTRDAQPFTLESLRDWCKQFIPPYSVPSVVVCVKDLPRNIMGKVNKRELIQEVFPETKR